MREGEAIITMNKFVSTLLKRSTLMITSFVLAVSSLSAAMPLFLSHTANATGETVISPTSLGGWQEYTQSGGDVSFVASSGAPIGNGALQLTTANDVNSVSSLYFETNIALNGINNLSYKTKQLAGPVGSANPSYYLGIDADGTGSDKFYVLYETYYNGSNIANQWQTWDIDNNNGKFWSSHAVGVLGSNSGGSYTKNFTLNDLKAAYPNAKVFEYGLNMGTYNPDWRSLVDGLDFNSTVYDFEPFTPPLAATQSTQTVLQSDFANAMDTWTYYSDTTNTPDSNATTNHEIVANPTPLPADNGAVKLNGANGDKWNLASAQYSGTKLRDISALGFSVRTSNPGSAYVNLDVDFNNPGITSSYQGRLVYIPSATANTWTNAEAVASNGMWRWSNMVTGTASAWPDGDTANERSWNDIISAFPDATVTAVNDVAFGSLYLRSDGTSTTYYDNVYLATSLKNVKYNFELPDTTAPNVPIHNSPSDGAVRTTSQQTLIDWWDVTDPSTPVTYFYQSSTSSATNGVGGSFVTPIYSSGPLSVSQIATPNTPEGTYYWHVKACDSLNNCTAWSNPWSLHIDNTAPVVVINSPTGSLFNSDVQVKGTVTDLNLRHYWLNIKKDGVTIINSTVLSSSFTNKLLATLTQDGDYVVTLAARDLAGGGSSTGNRSGDVVKEFTIDKTAPNAPNGLSMKVTSSNVNIVDGTSTNKSDVTASWLSNNTEPVTFIYKYWNDITGNQYKVGNEYPVHTSSTSYSGVLNQGQGVHHFCVVAVDLAGNESACSAPFTVGYDITNPSAAITTTGTQSTATPTISGTVDADATNLVFTIDGITQPLTWTAGNTTWTSTPTTALADGTHSMSIVATDSAGNQGGQAGTITISVPVTLLTAAPGETTPTPQATVTPGEVLGDQTTNEDIAKTGDNKTNQSPSILGDATTNNPMNLFGLAWYWWLAILAAIIAIWWIIAAALRRRDQGNA